MTVKEYKAKAEMLLKEYIDNYSEDDRNSFILSEQAKRCNEIKDEFLHLVFFFNPDMPLYKEMISFSDIPPFTKYNREPKKYMERFIYYLNEFFCNDSVDLHGLKTNVDL